jgi:hypothetical protein
MARQLRVAQRDRTRVFWGAPPTVAVANVRSGWSQDQIEQDLIERSEDMYHYDHRAGGSRPSHPVFLQRRLFDPSALATPVELGEPQLVTWGLRDVRALAIDPDVEMRRLAALSPWVIDADLQTVLATDPDETVVLNLLKRVDPHREANLHILASRHTAARRELARRNLTTATLLTIIDDQDDEVRWAARATLERRGVVASGELEWSTIDDRRARA